MRSKLSANLFSSWFRDNDFYDDGALRSSRKVRKEAEKKVLDLFRRAAHDIPAYKDFLRKNKIKPESVKTISTFNNIPYMTKENYICNYPLKERCWGGTLDGLHMVSTSSGTTGAPTFWPRNLQAEISGAYSHELIFKGICNVDKRRTLLVNGFAMGNWIAGTFTLSCSNLIAWKGYSLTIMTPGYSTEAVLEVLNGISDEFEQIIITGHTPFLKELVELVDINRLNRYKRKMLVLLGTGQSITENWREYIISKLNSSDYYNTFINLYGSADAALMGFETPFTIQIRKILSKDPVHSKKIFNDERLPSIYQYDPRLTYFDVVENELCITKDTGVPLIKYNVHDEGGLMSTMNFSSLTDGKNWKPVLRWDLPIVYLYGRDKFMVKIYGANIYTEHVQQALSHTDLQSFLTGRFKMEIDYDENHNQKLICRVELRAGVTAGETLAKKARNIFIGEVRAINSEYNYILNSMGRAGEPIVILHKYGDKRYFPAGKMVKMA